MPAVAIYARKSTESEDRQILSIDSQIRELKDFAARRGLVVGHVLTESKSAKSPGRPVFNELIGMVNKGEVGHLLCWKLDRLARNPVDGGALIWGLEEGKLEGIHTPSRSFANTGDDKFWMQLEFGMAKKYVDDLSQNVKRGLREKLERGWLPGRARLGYLNEPVDRTIVPDPERFDVVQRVLKLMLTGRYNPRQLHRIACYDWGLRTRESKRSGGGPLSVSGIYKLLINPFYYGAILRNGVLYQGKHKPMITKSEFDKIQYLLGLRSKPRPQQNTFAFTGLIRCGECGCSITAENRVQRHGHRYVYYRCTKKKLGVRCSQRHVQVGEVERQIGAFLETITVSKRMVEWVNGLLVRMHKEELAQDEVESGSVQRRYDACKRELGELVNVRLRGLIDDEEFRQKKNELEEERFRLAELRDAGEGRFQDIQKRVIEAFEFASTAKYTLETGNIDEKRQVLQFVGSNLVLLNGKLLIKPRIPLELIREALKGLRFKKFALEPPIIGELERRIERRDVVVMQLSRLVSDVRTFFKNSSPLRPEYHQGR